MAQNPHPFGSIKYDDWQYQHPEAPNGTDQALADAKGTLASADRFSKENLDPMEGAPEQNGFLNDTSGSVFDSFYDKLARLGRQVVRPIPGAIEGAAGVGSLLPGPVGTASRAITGAKSGSDLLSGGMEGLKEHPIRSAMDALGVGAGVSSLKGLKGLLGAGEEAVAGVKGLRNIGRESTEKAYRMGSSVQPRPSVAALKNPEYAAELERAANPGKMSDFGRNSDAFVNESRAGKFGPEQAGWAKRQTNPAFKKFAQEAPEEAFVGDLPEVPEFSFEAGEANVPGLTAGKSPLQLWNESFRAATPTAGATKLPSALERLPGEEELARTIAQKNASMTTRAQTRPSRARKATPSNEPVPPGRIANEEALARRRKK